MCNTIADSEETDQKYWLWADSDSASCLLIHSCLCSKLPDYLYRTQWPNAMIVEFD